MHKYKKIILIFLSGILLSGCSSNMAAVSELQTEEQSETTMQKEWNYAFHYGSDYWAHYDLADSFIPTQEAYEKLVAQYIPQIETLIGAGDWYVDYSPEADTILVNMEMGTTPHSYTYPTSKGADHTIEFSQLLSLKQVNSPVDRALPHELTHSLLGNGKCFSNSLEEGICNYVCARVGIVNSDFYETYQIDLMDMLYCGTKSALEKYYDEDKKKEMLDSIGRGEGYTYAIQTDDGIIWYSCSQCFVEYLVKNYGMEKTMRLIREGKTEDDYQSCLGISFDALKQDWVTDFWQYEPMYTEEEYLQMSRSFLAALQSP